MGYIAKMPFLIRLFSCVCFLTMPFLANAAELLDNITENKAEYTFSFKKGYSAFDTLEDNNTKKLIFSFDTTEKLTFAKQNYFNIPIKSAELTNTGTRYRLTIEFKDSIITPSVLKGEKEVKISFTLPNRAPVGSFANTIATNDNRQTPTIPTTTGPTASTYVRMIFGLLIILVAIFTLFWVMKTFFKKQVSTDIPGSARLLGKVDLDLRKSLYFYEIGDTIYIIGITENAINLIDKISDEAEATKIRSGFLKKLDFGGYMSFFKRKEAVDTTISTTNTLVEEKLQALKNRNIKKS